MVHYPLPFQVRNRFESSGSKEYENEKNEMSKLGTGKVFDLARFRFITRDGVGTRSNGTLTLTQKR